MTDHSGIATEIQRSRPALYLVPHRAVFPYRFWRSGLGRSAGRIGARSRAVAVRPHPVLRFALLLLRLQHGGDARLQQNPALSGDARPGNGTHRAAGRHQSRGAPAALGRRHADLSESRRHPPPDGDDAAAFHPGRRCRNQLRSRSARTDARASGGLARIRLQPPVVRRAGHGPGRAAGGQPHPVRGTDPAGARLVARTGFFQHQSGSDRRPAEADRREFQPHPGTD